MDSEGVVDRESVSSVEERFFQGGIWIVGLVVLLVVSGALRLLFKGGNLLPWIQLIGAPCVAVALSQISVDRCRIPRWVVAVALIGTVFGGILTYSHVDLSNGAFIVTHFKEDDSEKETKIFRDRIRRTVGWRGLTLVGSHFDSVNSDQEARALLEANSKLGGVIWGTPRWLSVTLRRAAPQPLFEGEGAQFASDYMVPKRLFHLKLVTSISGVGLSTSTEYPTVEFLGRLAEIWGVFTDVLKSPQKDGDFEMLSRSLAGVKGKWTTFSHRALPMWMTGSYHLRRAVLRESDSYGEVQCAIRAFGAALAQLRPGDNQELRAAILNNQALAYIVKAQQAKNRVTMMTQARVLLKEAATLLPKKHGATSGNSPTAISETVRYNLRLLVAKKKMRREKARSDAVVSRK